VVFLETPGFSLQPSPVSLPVFTASLRWYFRERAGEAAKWKIAVCGAGGTSQTNHLLMTLNAK